jgi:hypothetical protein
MTKLFWALPIALILGACAALEEPVRPVPNVLTTVEQSEGFQLIFDGHNPDGWEGGEWEIVNGSWIPLPESRGGLRSSEEWQNFHLKASVYISGDKNSGIFIRCPKEERVFPRNCYEINIRDDYETYPTGSIVNLATALERVRTKGTWNTIEVIADGAHLEVRVNGVTTADIYNTRFTEPGTISFQNSDGEGNLRVRSLKLKVLD